MANAPIVLSDATSMLDEVYRMKAVRQQARFGATAQHISNKKVKWAGGAMHRKLVNQIYTGARVTSSLEATLPDSTKINTVDVTIEESHLRRLAATIGRSIPASLEMDGSEHAVFNIARELAVQSHQALGEKRNQLLNSNADCVKAIIDTMYADDGDTWSASTTLTAFLKLKSGSVSKFHEGEILDIRTGSDNADLRCAVTVNDVIPDEYLFGRNVGPGIVVTYLSAGTGGETNLDAVVADDELVAHGELAYNYPVTFNSLADLTSSPGAYFDQTRTTVGNRYLIPMGRDWSSGGTYGNGDGTKVDFDIDTHFGVMANSFARLLPGAREYMKGQENDDFKLTDAMIAQATPELVNEMAKQAGDSSKRFTTRLASDLDAAVRKKLVAVAGWHGSVLFHPNLPPIVLQPEPLMDEGEMRLFEPNAWEVIRMGGTSERPQWVPGGTIGGIWHPVYNAGSTNTILTMNLQAATFIIELFFCQQPKLLYRALGLQDTI